MAKPAEQNNPKLPRGLMLLVLVLLAGVSVWAFVVKNRTTSAAKGPSNIRNRAVEQHLLGWIRDRLHDHWMNGTVFLSDGTYQWGATYHFEAVASSQAEETERQSALTATIKYGNLEEGDVLVDIDSGTIHEFNKDTNQFQEPRRDVDLNRDSWQTIYIQLYELNP